jgi:hypothetical protein
LRRAVVLCGAASFIMGFLGTLLAFRLVLPSSATAQANQSDEVRASAFVLIGRDGSTEVGRFGLGGPGNESLSLSTGEGTRRHILSGNGTVTTFDSDGGTVTFAAGRRTEASVVGEPPVNGVVLGLGGSVDTMLEP